MKTAFSIAFLSFICASSAIAQVGYWRFEGTTGGSVGTVINEITPGTLDGTGSASATYNGSIIGPTIWDPISGATYINSTSLNIGGSSSVTVTDAPALDAPSFTIEAFIRTPNQSSYPNYVSHRNSGANLGWQVDIDPQNEGRTRFDTAASTNQTAGGTAGQSLADNRWHHTAVTFDASTKKISLYTDYGVIATKTLSGTPSDATSVAADLIFGGPSWPAGAAVDEVRYTNSVLNSSQFLRSVNNGFWRFEGTAGDTIGVVPNSANVGVLDGNGDTSAIYASDRPATAIIDPIMNNVHVNTSSLDMNSGKVVVADNDQLDAPGFTMEAFVKVADQGGYPPFIDRLDAGKGWQIDIDPSERARGRIDTGASGNQVVGSGGAQALGDGQWHHVALTFDGVTARLYVDGVVAARNISGSKADVTNTANDLFFGGSSFSPGSYVDEVRFSASVLGPSEFLQAVSSPLLQVNPADGTSLDLGVIELGDFAEQMINIANIGDPGTDLTVNSVMFSGADADLFSAPGFVPGMTIAAGSSYDLTVRLDGLDYGDVDALLTILVDQGAFGPTTLTYDLSAFIAPEPASIAIWSLVGFGLVGFSIYRTRRQK